MNEYEYSFKVPSLEPYINYCENEGYEKVEETSQIRELYSSSNNVLARITTKKTANGIVTSLDFKDDDDSDKILKESRESIPLIINKDNRAAIDSILDILGYQKIKHLDRKRVVYTKANVMFEIDEYFSPEKMYVVAIEGEKTKVDEVYTILKEKINL